MAPRKDKNKMIDDGECAAAASKRRRITEILNGVNGVPFTNPITQFPSIHLLHQHRNRPQNTTAVGIDLQLSPPSPEDEEEEEQEQGDDDGFISSLISQQNFIINYHMNLTLQSVEEFWRRNLGGEVKQRKEIERKLKDKEEQADRFRQMYHFYEERAFILEEMLQRKAAGEGCSNAAAAVAPVEEVQSCFVDVNMSAAQLRMEMLCKNCRNRPATMLWLPCRHLCVCLVCERRVKICPICSAKKTESFKINLP